MITLHNQLIFDRVIEQGGHSTISLFINGDRSSKKDFDALTHFAKVSDGWLRPGVPGMLLIDLGPEADLEKAQDFLARWFVRGISVHWWRSVRLHPEYLPEYQEAEYVTSGKSEDSVRRYLSSDHAITFATDFREEMKTLNGSGIGVDCNVQKNRVDIEGWNGNWFEEFDRAVDGLDWISKVKSERYDRAPA